MALQAHSRTLACMPLHRNDYNTILYITDCVSCRFIPHYVYRVQQSGRQSVSVWGCLSAQGLGPLVRIQGKFSSESYKEIIASHLVPYALDGPFPDGCYHYQHDRSPVHMSAAVQKEMEALGIHQLVWPPHSPDLNIIESVWGILKAKLSARRQPLRSAEALWEAVNAEWNTLQYDHTLVRNLYASLPRRMRAVIETNGKPTRY